VTAWYVFLKNPTVATRFDRSLSAVRAVLDNKYYFDWFNEHVLAAGSRALGRLFWRGGDQAIIDGALVNGSAGLVGVLAGVVRRVQTGLLYSYAFWMVIGLALMLAWVLMRA
jgi:NADH-quinone oxidoreductase subunit L